MTEWPDGNMTADGIADWIPPVRFLGNAAGHSLADGCNVIPGEGESLRFVATHAEVGDVIVQDHLVVTVDVDGLVAVHFNSLIGGTDDAPAFEARSRHFESAGAVWIEHNEHQQVWTFS